MFDAAYKFTQIGQTLHPFPERNNLLKTLHYSFKTESHHYLIDVKCYVSSLYVIEFFLRTDKNSKKASKYGKLTYEMKTSRIIRTCFDVMMTILADDNKASFAFIGSPVFINHLQMESIENTKRFNIYRYVAINLIGRKSFELFEDEQTSCVLIANKLSDIDIVKQEANVILQSMF